MLKQPSYSKLLTTTIEDKLGGMHNYKPAFMMDSRTYLLLVARLQPKMISMTLSICMLFGTKRYWLLSLPSQGKLVHACLAPKFSQTMFFIFAEVAISYLVAAKCATRYVLNHKKASTDTVIYKYWCWYQWYPLLWYCIGLIPSPMPSLPPFAVQ